MDFDRMHLLLITLVTGLTSALVEGWVGKEMLDASSVEGA